MEKDRWLSRRRSVHSEKERAGHFHRFRLAFSTWSSITLADERIPPQDIGDFFQVPSARSGGRPCSPEDKFPRNSALHGERVLAASDRLTFPGSKRCDETPVHWRRHAPSTQARQSAAAGRPVSADLGSGPYKELACSLLDLCRP